MEVWTEQFRLWLAAELLQPLDKLVRRAQKVPCRAQCMHTQAMAAFPLDSTLLLLRDHQI